MLGNNTKTRIPETLWSNDRFGFIFYKQLIPLLAEVCKLFSYGLKSRYALLASKRHPIDLQKVPF